MISSILILPLVASAIYAAPNKHLVNRANSALDARGTLSGSALAVWNNGVEMLTPVKIAGKTYKVVLDTGSADMWVFCTEGGDKMEANRTAYNPTTGKKMEPKGQFNIKYGAGFAKGSVYTDKVEISGIVVDQAIGCATSVDTDDINDRNMEGLIGIGFNSGSKNVHNGRDQSPSATKSAMNSVTTEGGGFLGLFKSQQKNAQNTWTENAFSQLKEGFFTADIKKSEDGAYNFGYIDNDRFSTTLTYMPVRSWNQWIVEMDSFTVGTNGTGTTKAGVKKALIDTGTTNILLPIDSAKAYYAAVPKSTTTDSKTWYVPCDTSAAAMPDFTVTFKPPTLAAGAVSNFPAGAGGVGRDPYNAVVSGSYLIGGGSGKNDGMCQGSIQGTSSGNGWDVILGDVFMMSQLIVFDMGDPNGTKDKNMPEAGQIGFAPKPSSSVGEIMGR